MRKHSQKLINFLPLLISVAVAMPIIFTQSVYADANSDASAKRIMDTVKQTELFKCYSLGGLKSEILIENTTDKIGYDRIFNDISIGEDSVYASDTDGDQIVLLPNHMFAHNVKDDNLSCPQLIGGFDDDGGSWTGVVEGVSDGMSYDQAKTALTNLGYKAPSDGGKSKTCVKFKYALNNAKSVNLNNSKFDDYKESDEFCISNLDGSGESAKITANSIIDEMPKRGSLASSFTFEIGDERKEIKICEFSATHNSTGYSSSPCSYGRVSFADSNMTVKEFAEAIRDKLPGTSDQNAIGIPYNRGHMTQDMGYYELERANDGIDIHGSGDLGSWTLNWGEGVKTPLKNLGWVYQGGSITFKVQPEDKSYLNEWYFTKFYEARLVCEGDEEYDHRPISSLEFSDTSRTFDGKKCAVITDNAANRDKSVRTFKSDLTWYQLYTLQELIDNMTEEELLNAATVQDPSASAQEDPPDEGKCDDVDLHGMGWLLCSATDNLKDSIDPLEKTIREMLSVKTGLYSVQGADGGDSPTYIAWDMIRSLANIIMIVFFLVVIFSQVTGVGINNYGIKKILPKLIVSAVLINLSFIICQILVDISNILGVGLSGLFSDIANQILPADSPQNIISGIAGGIIAVAAGAGGTIAATALTVATIGGAGGILVIVLLCALIVVLVALLLFFLMLGARMLIVVVCVALAPLAFACYILPNTEFAFKKWVKLFQAALIVYPICGAVYGISLILRAIIMGGGTGEILFWEAIIAIIAPYLPFFMMPTLLKGAISAMGVAGSALIGMGTSFKNSVTQTTNAVQNAEWFKNRQAMAQAAHSQKIVSRLSQPGKELSKAQQRKLSYHARLRGAYERQETEAANDILMAGGIRDPETGASVDIHNYDQMDKALRSMLKTGDPNDVYAISAMTSALGKTRKGMNTLGQILDSGEVNVNSEGGKRFLSNLVDNPNTKGQAYGLNETALNLLNNNGKGYEAGIVQKSYSDPNNLHKIKGEQLAGLADDQRKAYTQAFNDSQVAQTAYDTIMNEQALKGMDGDAKSDYATLIAKNAIANGNGARALEMKEQFGGYLDKSLTPEEMKNLDRLASREQARMRRNNRRTS